MKNAKTIALLTLLALGVACSYSKPATTPPAAGNMPNIGSLIPNSAAAGTSLGTNGLMVTGTSFNGNAVVNWNGTPLTTTFVSATQLTATVPNSDTAASGTAKVTVTNPGTTGGTYGGGTAPETSQPATFTVN